MTSFQVETNKRVVARASIEMDPLPPFSRHVDCITKLISSLSSICFRCFDSITRLFFFCLLANVRNMLPDSTILYLFCKCRRLWWCRTGSARITSIDSPPRVPASSFHRGIRCGESPFTCRRTRISTTSS